MNVLPCFKCGKKLESAIPIESEVELQQPSEGTVFYAHGQYGSTVFDPQDNSYLELNLCDVCLTDGASKGTILIARERITKHVAYSQWIP